MSLTNRVILYFLITLAIVLLGCSMGFYWVTRAHVERQFDSELQGVLNALVAAAEVEETEVKWQPLEHSIQFDSHDEFGEVYWGVVGDDGLIVEQSRSSRTSVPREELRKWITAADLNGNSIREINDRWAVVGKQLIAPHPDRENRELDEFDQLTIVAARMTTSRDAVLFRLTLLVTLLPALAWIVAAMLGRWGVRRALRPVIHLANQAQTFSGSDFRSRLQYRETNDELEELGLAFNRLLDRQQVAFEQQQRFAGNAAHELRTPLTVLLGQIDVTLRRPRSESEYQSNLESLRSQTHKLQEIVESLLFLARHNSDAVPPGLRRMEVEPWFNEQKAVWMTGSRSEDIRFEFQLAKTAEVRATPALLGRILDNLIHNALKYTADGTPIVISARQSENHLIIDVQDFGPGIQPENVPKLFEPFFRTDDARNRGVAGTGLGLAIASRIAEMLNGSLQCRSEPGEQTCFELKLPLL